MKPDHCFLFDVSITKCNLVAEFNRVLSFSQNYFFILSFQSMDVLACGLGDINKELQPILNASLPS